MAQARPLRNAGRGAAFVIADFVGHGYIMMTATVEQLRRVCGIRRPLETSASVLMVVPLDTCVHRTNLKAGEAPKRANRILEGIRSN